MVKIKMRRICRNVRDVRIKIKINMLVVMIDVIDLSVKNFIEFEYLNKRWFWFYKIFVKNYYIIFFYKNYKEKKDFRN